MFYLSTHDSVILSCLLVIYQPPKKTSKAYLYDVPLKMTKFRHNIKTAPRQFNFSHGELSNPINKMSERL